MKRLVLVILSCSFSAFMSGQQTISVPVIVEGDQAALSLKDSDLNVEINHQHTTASSFTPLAGQHLLYTVIYGGRSKTLWPKGSDQQHDVASRFLTEVITAGVDIGSLINFGNEYYLDVSDQKDPQQLAAKLWNDQYFAALYDAVVATADYLAKKPDIPGYRKVMFLFCDGENDQSALRFNQATERLQRYGIPLFIFAPSAVKKKEQGKNLSKLALELGGRVYFVSDNTKTVNFDSVKQDLGRGFLLRISIPASQAMQSLNVVPTSQQKVSIIAPSKIGVSLIRHGVPPSQPAQGQVTDPIQVTKKPAYTQEQLAELRAKCASYTNTKVEDLESKRVPLPPHECVGVLGWMRDSRVTDLYPTEKLARLGPAQQQYATPGASTAPASAAVAQVEHITLWGITVGAPAPAWPKCTGKDGSATENDPACLQAILGSAPEQEQRLGNLLGYATASTAVTIRAGVVWRIQIQMSSNETCRQVVPNLTKNLGEPAHTTLPVQNGSGAHWDADIYVWHTADGSEARLNAHTRYQEAMQLACTLEARSATAIARDDVGHEIMQLVVERDTTLADALDALTMVLINALRANYGYRDEFSRFSEQVSSFLEPMERDRTVGLIPLPGVLLSPKTQPKTVTKVEDRAKRLERLALEVSEILVKRRPSIPEGFDALSSTMLTAIEATCGRKRADEFDFRVARFAKEVMSLSQDNDNKGSSHNN